MPDDQPTPPPVQEKPSRDEELGSCLLTGLMILIFIAFIGGMIGFLTSLGDDSLGTVNQAWCGFFTCLIGFVLTMIWARQTFWPRN